MNRLDMIAMVRAATARQRKQKARADREVSALDDAMATLGRRSRRSSA